MAEIAYRSAKCARDNEVAEYLRYFAYSLAIVSCLS